MSSCVDVSSEQLCYIPCNFCNIVLAVSVPCSSLFDIVTVRCGHCANLWSVNMAASAFHSFSPSSWQQQQQHPHHPQQQLPHPHQLSTSVNPSHHMRMENANLGSRYYGNKAVGGTMRPAPGTSSSSDHSVSERVVNRPPEKRQRVPSAYNQFIKEEIQRIKANNPDISHREAFSTAAKNWAHFPHIHFGLMLDNNNQAKHSEARTALLN